MSERELTQHERRLQKLARYVRRHGFIAKIENGKLFCRSELTKSDHPGKLFFQWDEVEANPEAVRFWLGY